MASKHYPTPMLDVLEEGPWPSFISGFKRLRDEHPDERIRSTVNGLLGQLVDLRVVPVLEAVGDDRRLAHGDIGKRAAVDKGGIVLQGLHQVGLYGIFQQGSHRTVCLEITGVYR